MEELGKVHQLIIPIFGHKMTFNLEVILMSWIVMGALIVFGFYTTRKSRIQPGLFQVVGELIVSSIFGLTEDALDPTLKGNPTVNKQGINNLNEFVKSHQP